MASQLQELENMSLTINSLNDKINRLSNENIGLGDEARNAQ